MGQIGTKSPQQSAVYLAESKIRWESTGTLEETQAWVDSLTSTDWWTDRYPHIVRVEIDQHHGNVRKVAATAQSDHANSTGTVTLARTGFTKDTVLHEMAHVICGNGVGHSGEWVRTYLTLTYLVMGSDCYRELFEALSVAGADLD